MTGNPYIRMNGQQVFKLAVSSLAASAQEVCAMAGLKSADITVWVPHQANSRIISMVGEKLGIPLEKQCLPWRITAIRRRRPCPWRLMKPLKQAA